VLLRNNFALTETGLESHDYNHQILPLTNSKKIEVKNSIIDLMDAYIQLQLAKAWQSKRSDGLHHFRHLVESAKEKISTYPEVFENSRDQYYALHTILGSLQKIVRSPDQYHYSIADWTQPFSQINLKNLYSSERFLFDFVSSLVKIGSQHVAKNIPIQKLTAWAWNTILDNSKRDGLLILSPLLLKSVIQMATSTTIITEENIYKEIYKYNRLSEKMASNKKQLHQTHIVDELKHIAMDINLEIGESYPWDKLADIFDTSTWYVLRMYATFIQLSLIDCASFSSTELKPIDMPSHMRDQFQSVSHLRGLAITYRGSDRETRIISRSIVNSDNASIKINDKKIEDSLVVLIPNNNPEHDIEKQLALLSWQLDQRWRQHHLNQTNKIEIFGALPPNLRALAVNHSIRRKFAKTKKTILFCLAALLAEDIYQNRRNRNTIHNGKSIRTREDADEYSVKLLKELGFTYSRESLRKGHTKFRKEFLDRVPEVFGFSAYISHPQQKNK